MNVFTDFYFLFFVPDVNGELLLFTLPGGIEVTTRVASSDIVRAAILESGLCRELPISQSIQNTSSTFGNSGSEAIESSSEADEDKDSDNLSDLATKIVGTSMQIDVPSEGGKFRWDGNKFVVLKLTPTKAPDEKPSGIHQEAPPPVIEPRRVRKQIFKECKICNKKLHSKNYRRHILRHENILKQCNICFRSFASGANIARHKKTTCPGRVA